MCGYKQIAVFLFIWFIKNNALLNKSNCLRLIENNALATFNLMIAGSRTKEKDMIAKVIINLINRNN